MPTGGFGKIKSKPPAPAAPEERYLCAACGGHDIGTTTVKEGVVEDMTTIRHVIGQLDWQPRPIATVNIDGGARILAACSMTPARTIGLRSSRKTVRLTLGGRSKSKDVQVSE